MDLQRAERRFYPFTSNNPYDSLVKKWSLALFGEPVQAKADRHALVDRLFREFTTFNNPPSPRSTTSVGLVPSLSLVKSQAHPGVERSTGKE